MKIRAEFDLSKECDRRDLRIYEDAMNMFDFIESLKEYFSKDIEGDDRNIVLMLLKQFNLDE